MTMTPPEWLTRHNCTWKANGDGKSWVVMLGSQPHYLLVPVPAAGKFTCLIKQTINGKNIPSPGTYPSAAEALRGGLEDLRQALGW